MNKVDLVKALKKLKVQTGSLACLGCGYEYSCTTKGCAIIRKAIKELEELKTPKLRNKNTESKAEEVLAFEKLELFERESKTGEIKK